MVDLPLAYMNMNGVHVMAWNMAWQGTVGVKEVPTSKLYITPAQSANRQRMQAWFAFFNTRVECFHLQTWTVPIT
jgi:hypothetical protein